MGTITILDYTTKEPLSMIGVCAGVCWGAPIDNDEKNQKRGLDCIESGHGRTTEFPDVYMIIDGYSARVMRELYTHIGGAPTRLQASTRYIDYSNKGLPYITPKAIENAEAAKGEYEYAMNIVQNIAQSLEANHNIPREDVANLFPLGMESKMMYKVNLRTLTDMSHQRMCNRAYWEFRQLFNDIVVALSNYSEQWKHLTELCFKPKCMVCGFCTETKSCHKMPSKKELIAALENSVIGAPKDVAIINKFLNALKN